MAQTDRTDRRTDGQCEGREQWFGAEETKMQLSALWLKMLATKAPNGTGREMMGY